MHPATDVGQWTTAVPDPAVIIADGSHAHVKVRNGRLIIEDGTPSHNRIREIPRIPRTVERVIILARFGYVTFEALRWLAGAGIGITHMAEEVTMTSGPLHGDWRTVLKQVDRDVKIARYLLATKLSGQAHLMRQPLENNEVYILSKIVEHQQSIERMRGSEGRAASLYWDWWQNNIAIPWSPDDLVKVPEHWRRFPGRASQHTSWETNRHATDPVNAMLNYVYKILETETLHVCEAYGFHPDLGIIHANGTDRHAFVLDLMEPVRPFCDKLVIELMRGLEPRAPGTFGPVKEYWPRRWQHETRSGQCVLDPPLTHRIAGWAADIRAAIIPHAETVKGMMK